MVGSLSKGKSVPKGAEKKFPLTNMDMPSFWKDLAIESFRHIHKLILTIKILFY